MYKSLSIRLEGIILIHLSVAHQALEIWADGFAKDDMVDSGLAVSGLGITLGNVIIQNDEFLSDGVDIAGD